MLLLRIAEPSMIPLQYTLSSVRSSVKVLTWEGLLHLQGPADLLPEPRQLPVQALRPTPPQCARDLLRTTPWSGLTPQSPVQDRLVLYPLQPVHFPLRDHAGP